MNKLLSSILIGSAGLLLAGLTQTVTAEPQYTVAGAGKNQTAWFIRYEEGILAGAKENGMEAVYSAGLTSEPKEQSDILSTDISKGVNALLVVPNDAKYLEEVFRQAREKGIAVVTHESPQQVNADFDVEMLDNEKFGELMMDEFVKFSRNKKGKYAIFVGSLTVPAHNIWADAAIARQKAKYPDLEFIDKFPVSEDAVASKKTALELLEKYPDLVGFITMGSAGAPAVSAALKAKKLKNKKTFVGVTTPKIARKNLRDGYMDECLLWDPANAARIQAKIAKLVLSGKADTIKPGFTLEGFGSPRIDGNTLIFNLPLLVTKDNVEENLF